MSDRALSDVVGYILIFALILLTATTAVTLGTSALTDVRDTEQANNAEAAFDILAENIADHAHDRETGRATEIKVADADLYFGDREYMYVNISPVGDDNTTSIRNDPIVYESRGGSKVVYSNGALFRETDDGSYMFREPDFRIDDDRTVMSQIEIDGIGDRLSVRGSRTVLVRTENWGTQLFQNASADEYDVTIEIVTGGERAAAWKNYLEDAHPILDGNCSDPDGTGLSDGRTSVECDYSTEEIYLAVSRLTAEIT